MSTLKVNTIQDASGGNASTAEQINKGRAKAWINFNGTGTPSIVGSFNISSISDQGTGSYRISYSTALANDNYCACMMPRGNSVTAGVYDQGDLTTTHLDYQSRNGQGQMTDREILGFAVFGD